MRKPALALPRQIKIPDPLISAEKLTVMGMKMQCLAAGVPDADMFCIALDYRTEFPGAALVMMAAAIHEQID